MAVVQGLNKCRGTSFLWGLREPVCAGAQRNAIEEVLRHCVTDAAWRCLMLDCLS